MRRRLGQSVRNATNTHDCVFIFLAIGYRDSRADRESVTFFAPSFRSRPDRTADEATGVVPIKNPGAGRTSAPRDDPQVWREEHEQITIRVDPDLLAAISERQSMAIVKQPRSTFAGERQSAGEDTCAHRIINSARNPFVAAHYSILSFAFAASLVCHCMLSGVSAPPRGFTW